MCGRGLPGRLRPGRAGLPAALGQLAPQSGGSPRLHVLIRVEVLPDPGEAAAQRVAIGAVAANREAVVQRIGPDLVFLPQARFRDQSVPERDIEVVWHPDRVGPARELDRRVETM